MADVTESLDIALALIRGDLDRIAKAVQETDRRMDVGERIAVVSYAGALVDAQKADAAALAAAEKEAAKLPPTELLRRLAELPAVREAMASRGGAQELPALGKGRHLNQDGASMEDTRGKRRRGDF